MENARERIIGIKQRITRVYRLSMYSVVVKSECRNMKRQNEVNSKPSRFVLTKYSINVATIDSAEKLQVPNV